MPVRFLSDAELARRALRRRALRRRALRRTAEAALPQH
jgi:hypothetical protein